MYCNNCGKELDDTVNFCSACGAMVGTKTVKRHNKASIIILTLLVGSLGVHKFYEGKKREGFIYLLGGLFSMYMMFLLTMEFEYVIDDPFLVIISILPSIFMGIALLSDLIKTLES